MRDSHREVDARESEDTCIVRFRGGIPAVQQRCIHRQHGAHRFLWWLPVHLEEVPRPRDRVDQRVRGHACPTLRVTPTIRPAPAVLLAAHAGLGGGRVAPPIPAPRGLVGDAGTTGARLPRRARAVRAIPAALARVARPVPARPGGLPPILSRGIPPIPVVAPSAAPRGDHGRAERAAQGSHGHRSSSFSLVSKGQGERTGGVFACQIHIRVYHAGWLWGLSRAAPRSIVDSVVWCGTLGVCILNYSRYASRDHPYQHCLPAPNASDPPTHDSTGCVFEVRHPSGRARARTVPELPLPPWTRCAPCDERPPVLGRAHGIHRARARGTP